MRRIDLGPIPSLDRKGERVMRADGTPDELDAKTWLADRILGSDPVNGMDFREAKARLDIMRKIEDGGEFVLLEEVEWHMLRDAFDAFKIAVVLPAFITLGERVHDAETIQPDG